MEGVLQLPNRAARSEEEPAPAPTAANLPVVVQWLSRVRLFVTSRTAALQASLSFAVSRSVLKFTSIESVMPSNHLTLCRPLICLASRFFPGARGALMPSRSPHSAALHGHRLPQPLITTAPGPSNRGIDSCLRLVQAHEPQLQSWLQRTPKRTSSHSPLVPSCFLAPSPPCTQLAPNKLVPGYDRWGWFPL